MTAFEYYQLLVKSATDGTFPSVSVDGRRCLYRGSKRKKCAAGLLIHDEKYDVSLEDRDLSYLRTVGALELPEGLTEFDVYAVQWVHDALAKRGFWDSASFLKDIDELPCFSGFAERLSHQKKE